MFQQPIIQHSEICSLLQLAPGLFYCLENSPDGTTQCDIQYTRAIQLQTQLGQIFKPENKGEPDIFSNLFKPFFF